MSDEENDFVGEETKGDGVSRTAAARSRALATPVARCSVSPYIENLSEYIAVWDLAKSGPHIVARPPRSVEFKVLGCEPAVIDEETTVARLRLRDMTSGNVFSIDYRLSEDDGEEYCGYNQHGTVHEPRGRLVGQSGHPELPAWVVNAAARKTPACRAYLQTLYEMKQHRVRVRPILFKGDPPGTGPRKPAPGVLEYYSRQSAPRQPRRKTAPGTFPPRKPAPGVQEYSEDIDFDAEDDDEDEDDDKADE